ncbi:hypothetical protein [Longispora fulva]|uniref:DUF3558 domain-containing protein n=1 Tax=Longispora fulva TaxID=619741 RepID=A0A8J7KDW2_9ACTN|nr:hypothetical protein [Longispora fulva]MBG6134490.1 hypothetical protein [Longispora fulva]
MRWAIAAAGLAAVLLTTGCASDGGDRTESGARDASPTAAGSKAGGSNGSPTLRPITSCDEVAPLVAPYLQGMQLIAEASTAGHDGFTCHWTTPVGSSDTRNLTVGGTVVDDVPPRPDQLPPPMTEVKDERIAAMHGIAWSYSLPNDYSSAVTYTIRTPHAAIVLTAGQWGDRPALDPKTAIDAAVKLLIA